MPNIQPLFEDPVGEPVEDRMCPQACDEERDHVVIEADKEASHLVDDNVGEAEADPLELSKNEDDEVDVLYNIKEKINIAIGFVGGCELEYDDDIQRLP